MSITPTPIRRHKRLLGRLIRRREHRLATYTCLLSILLCFLLGMERYQAQEIRAFVQEAEKKQGDASWILYRAAQRRQERMVRWETVAQSYPPAASDRVDVRQLSVQADLRASADTPVVILRSQKQEVFPAFGHTEFPVSVVPDWGAMRTAAEWDRPFSQIPATEFVPLPAYDLSTLQIPLSSLTNPIRSASIPVLTAKLTYSTRYYGAYDLDAGEFSGLHPGIDLKIAFGTPVGAIAGGRVHLVSKNEEGLGLYVIVEHHLENSEKIYSIYGHLDTARVQEGEDMEPGQIIGMVGLSGRTTAPHLHLQIDRDDGSEPHQPYWPSSLPSSVEADRHTAHPVFFIERFAWGE
ncbi:MAG: M23 family metallopeptidase [Candidatus Peribacteraceae bacterium]|nr:M23 family metallopeptidase [Candidatus Peribacteraceae bacterium]